MSTLAQSAVADPGLESDEDSASDGPQIPPPVRVAPAPAAVVASVSPPRAKPKPTVRQQLQAAQAAESATRTQLKRKGAAAVAGAVTTLLSVDTAFGAGTYAEHRLEDAKTVGGCFRRCCWESCAMGGRIAFLLLIVALVAATWNSVSYVFSVLARVTNVVRGV